MPDPPRNLQLTCDSGEDGTVKASWNAPDNGHGLIREYIVSDFQSESDVFFILAGFSQFPDKVVVEKVVENHLVAALNQHCILDDFQSGFHSLRRPCLEFLMPFPCSLTSSLTDAGLYVGL